VGLDQYSSYLDAREYAEMRLNTSGAYSGVGIEISLDAGLLKVVAAIDDSPAARAGIRGGDIVVAVDGVAVDPAHLDDAVERLRGKPGAHVKLTIRRADNPQTLEFDLVRRKVQVNSVKADVLEPGYGYVRVSQFTETTADDFLAAIKALQSGPPMRGLVLDLRNNPGGVLEAAVAVADIFLDSGVIVTAQGRALGADFKMQAQPGDLLNSAPITVLMNGGSASASEIVAGALKDHARAKLVGQTTYGKGSVQTVVPLEQGGALKLTTSRYHTPSGATIQQRGIAPDVALTDLAQTPPATSGQSKLLADDAELRVALATLKAQPVSSKAP
jgi:carboxyl-terminal processing protease